MNKNLRNLEEAKKVRTYYKNKLKGQPLTLIGLMG